MGTFPPWVWLAAFILIPFIAIQLARLLPTSLGWGVLAAGLISAALGVPLYLWDRKRARAGKEL